MYPKCVAPLPSPLPPTKGMVILVSPLQPSKAPLPILVTLSGIITLDNPLRPENALSNILTIPSAITILPCKLAGI